MKTLIIGLRMGLDGLYEHDLQDGGVAKWDGAQLAEAGATVRLASEIDGRIRSQSGRAPVKIVSDGGEILTYGLIA